MKKKSILIIIILILCLTLLEVCLYFGMNYFVIPRFINPGLETIAHPSPERPFIFAVGKVSFYPIRGFVLRDVVFSQTSDLAGSYILRTRLATIRLAFLPLLSKRLEIRSLWVVNPEINISRNEEGNWNIGFLFLTPKPEGKGSLILKELRVKNGRLNYADRFKKDNTLSRCFVNIDLKLKNIKPGFYRFILDANAENKTKESLALVLDYDSVAKRASGTVKLNTAYLGEYWDYYLDEMLKPWSFKADNASVEMQLSYSVDNLELEGQYTVSQGLLSYGDFNIRGNATVKQTLKYIKGQPVKEDNSTEICLRDGSLWAANKVLMSELGSQASITSGEIRLSRLSGIMSGLPLSLSGKFTRLPQQELHLTGKLSGINTEFDLKLLPGNQGVLDWRNARGTSYLNLKADIPDLKNLIFNLSLDADVKLEDLLRPRKDNPAGEIKISGKVTGEAEKFNSYQGEIAANAIGLTWLGLKPLSFDVSMPIKDGLLNGDIPQLDFYKGFLSGTIRMDIERWGAELLLDKVYLEELSGAVPDLKDNKGIFSGNLAFLADWADFNALKGGGYFKLTSSDLRGFPLFSTAESGIKSIIAGFIMPVFYNVEGNFSLDKEKISVNNAVCHGPTLDLGISGKYYFSGATDFTFGATIAGGGIVNTVRRIIFPFTIAVDLLANSIQVRVSGKWPELKQRTAIQPMAWFNDFLKIVNQVSPARYTLDKLWL